MFRIFEHTADLGIHVEAESFPALLVEAARALTSVLVANPEAVEPTTEVELDLDAAEAEDLLVDWLAEWLYRFSADHMLFAQFDAIEHDGRITARAWGEKADPARHRLDTEIKAVTYHRLKVEQSDAGWMAEVIVDL
ncbi:MAG: archease [Pirellulaceae bacterium]|nr:archease [Pirellulaceae bacterium]